MRKSLALSAVLALAASGAVAVATATPAAAASPGDACTIRLPVGPIEVDFSGHVVDSGSGYLACLPDTPILNLDPTLERFDINSLGARCDTWLLPATAYTDCEL